MKISPLNTRLIKYAENEFELRIASAIESTDKTPYIKNHEFTLENQEKIKVCVKAGDFSEIMQKVVEAME